MKYVQNATGFNVASVQQKLKNWGIEMNGLDQIIIALWFLPVVLFIIIPLCMGLAWLPISLFIKFIQQESEPVRPTQTAIS